MRRIVSISLPFWASERLARHRARHARSIKQPSLFKAQAGDAAQHSPVLTEQLAGGVRITASPLAWRSQGIHAGMTLADARAIRPDLPHTPRDLGGEAADLEQLAHWLTRYSPLVALDPLLESGGAAGLLIDSTGCDHLLGGEAALVRTITHRLAQAGISARLAIAPSIGAAWALARFGVPGSRTDQSGLQKTLRPLPVAALRLDDASLVTLSRLGLKYIGDLLSIPRPNLARRFRDQHKGSGAQSGRAVSHLLARLDQMLGKSGETLSPLRPPHDWRTHESFAEPVFDTGLMRAAITRCLDGLVQLLEQQERGIRRLDIQIFGTDGDIKILPVGTSRPSIDRAHLMRLIDEKLEGLTTDFGVDQITLAVLASDEQHAKQLGSSPRPADSSLLVDRLMGKLGAGSVSRLVHQPSHLPERQQKLKHPADLMSGKRDRSWDHLPRQAPRPIRILPRPEPVDVIAGIPENPPELFRWRRVSYRALRAEGPERFGSEWWMEALGLDQEREAASDISRDYYRVETQEGARFWLFRAGLYATPGVRVAELPANKIAPAWYMHGMFA